MARSTSSTTKFMTREELQAINEAKTAAQEALELIKKHQRLTALAGDLLRVTEPSALETQLEQHSKDNPIELDGRKRLKKALETLKSNSDKLQCEVVLTEDELK